MHAQAATWPAAHVENPGCPSAAPAGVYGQAAGFRVKVGIPTRTWRFCCCWTESSRNGKWVLLAQEAVLNAPDSVQNTRSETLLGLESIAIGRTAQKSSREAV